MINSFSTDIWLAGEDEVGEIFSNPDTKNRLFPDGRFIAYYEPYLATPSNMKLARKTSKLFLSGDKARGTVTAISLTSEIPCSTGLRYDLEFYGVNTEDALQHLYAYMKNLVALPHLDSLVAENVLYLPMCINRDVIAQKTHEFGWSPGAWTRYSHYIVMETKSHELVAKM